MSRPRVYICGPVTTGDMVKNQNDGADAQVELIRRGFAPLNPTLSLSLSEIHRRRIRHTEWVDVAYAWIECCDAVLRLPGNSVGADLKCDYAVDLGKPVFRSVASLARYFKM